MTKKLTTIRDVAREAGFSIGVVSTVLNNKKNSIGVSPDNRKKIIEMARRMNYRPSILARSFQSNQSFLIGVMPAEVNAPHLVDLLKGIRDQLSGTDYSPLLEIHGDAISETDAFNRLMRRRIDGLIVTTNVAADGSSKLDLYAEAAKHNLPVVQVFGRNIPDVPKVNLASFDDGHLQTQHLINMGHRKIVHVTHERYAEARRTGSEHHWDAWEQYRGYEQAMRAAKLTPVAQTFSLPDERGDSRTIMEAFIQGGVEAAPRLLSSPTRPSAVICYSDLVAAGFMQWCHQHGIKIPVKLSVVGYGDILSGLVTNPSLTTVAFPAREVGRQVTSQLLRLIREQPAENVTVPGSLVLRGSTAAPVVGKN